MKKLITLSIVAILLTTTQLNAQITFGVKGGGTMANLEFKGGDDAASKDLAKSFNASNKSRLAFHAGVTADIAVSEHLLIQPTLQFNQKGTSLEYTENLDKIKNKINLNYVELPVNLIYRQSSQGGFYGGVGPYIGYAINGNTISKKNDEAEKEAKIKFDEASGFNRLDFGANVLVGYELPAGFTVGANYSLGLADITDLKAFGLSSKSSYFGVSVGYKFKK